VIYISIDIIIVFVISLNAGSTFGKKCM